jgi:two-component system response regulator FixJ
MIRGKNNPLLLATKQSDDAAARIAALSPRCREVLNGIVAGRSSKMIAYELGISPRTVEIHRARLMQKLGAHNVADAVRLAYDAIYGAVPGR